MTILSGKEFNDKYPNTEFYKILMKNYRHNDFTYQHGLNVDHIPFNPTESCSPGGLYFTELDKLPMWIYLDIIYIAKVTIPSEAHVYVEAKSFKANKFILDLNNKMLIENFIWKKEDDGVHFSASYNNAYQLRFIKDQTDKICKLAVQKDSNTLQFVRNQTNELCELAVNQNGEALQFVINQTDKICKLAVCQNGNALKYVINQTDEICKLAVSQNGSALYDVINQTDEICKLAVNQTGTALYFVKNQTEELCKIAVKQNSVALHHVRIQTDEIRKLALCA